MRHTRALAAAGPALMIVLAAGTAHAQVRLSRQATAFNGGPSTGVAQPPGETRRLYQAVRTGSVRALRDGVALATPVLTIAGVVSGGESGLLGLAFHPQFQQNGYMYVLYTTGGPPAGTRIERYTLDPANPEVADPGSALQILTINRSPSTNHQGGWIGFGPDGHLYVSSGNGGNSSNSQALTTLLGKMLRLDVDADGFPSDPLRNYAIPPSNPFAGSASAANEIWAYGLRNPWRCSFDRQTGDLWIADVGDSSLEEFNFQPAIGLPPYTARNYGYTCMEGSTCKNVGGCPCYDGTLTLPVFEYGRGYGFANIGGCVYRGQAIPALRGSFIFGDYGSGLWSFRKTPAGIVDYRPLNADLGSNTLYSFGEDQAGELYVCTSSGPIYRIVAACPPNCDGSVTPPVLNVMDFSCFLQAFTSGDLFANCDGSTASPILNVADFSCFLQKFATGCP